MRRVLFLIIVLMPLGVWGCAGQTSYIKSNDIMQTGDFTSALNEINEAIYKDPTNVKFQKRKAIIVGEYLQSFEDNYVNISTYYLTIRKENLDARKSLINQIDSNHKNEIAYHLSAYNHNLNDYLADIQLIEDDINKIDQFFKKGELDQALISTKELINYEPYDQRVSDFIKSFANYKDYFQKHIESLIEDYKYKDVYVLVSSFNKILGRSGSFKDCNDYLVGSYKKRGEMYAEKGYPLISLTYNVIAKNAFDQPVYIDYEKTLENSFQHHKQKIYLKVLGDLFDNKNKDHNKTIVEDLNRSISSLFELTDVAKEADIILLINVLRKEHDVVSEGQEKVFSKFISRYNRVQNDRFYQAQSQLQFAQSEYQRIANQPTYGIADGFTKGYFMGLWRKKIRELRELLGSNYVYDNVPVYIDYSFYKENVSIRKYLELEFSIYDKWTGLKYGKEKYSDTKKHDITIKDGVHQKDSKGHRNSGKFDYEVERSEFETFIVQAVEDLTKKMQVNISKIFVDRSIKLTKDGNLTSAFELYLISKTIKDRFYISNTYSQNLNDSYVISFPCHIDELNPEKDVKMHPGEFDPVVLALFDTNRQLTSVHSETPTNDGVYDNPVIDESLDKVVEIRVVTQSGMKIGSGFFLNDDGYLITNYHVVSDAGQINVYDRKGKKISAKIVMSDSYSDLALLKADIEGNRYFEVKGYGRVKIGELVYAIGSPHGYEKTISAGIISAKRNMPLPFSSGNNLMQLQTDASITRGNSGGPLLDKKGEAIGVNTWTDNVKGDSGPLNFAISIDEAIKRFGYYIK